MFVVGGGTGRNRPVLDDLAQVLLLLVAERFQRRFGLGLGRQDALDRSQREGAESCRPLQGGSHVRFAVRFQQCQYPLGLALAHAMAFQQALQEAAGRRSQLRETLT